MSEFDIGDEARNACRRRWRGPRRSTTSGGRLEAPQVDDEEGIEAAEKLNDQVADCDEDEQEQLNQRLQALYERLDELDAATAEARASTRSSTASASPRKCSGCRRSPFRWLADARRHKILTCDTKNR